MTNPDFQARITRIQNSRASGPTPAVGTAKPPRTYRDRLARALAAAAAAGISRTAGFPPAMRALSALGIPVRPLHFQSIPSLFLSGLALGLAIFGGVLWLFTSNLVPFVPAGPIRGIVTLGWPGVVVTSVCIGIAFAALIRLQANRARLPRWQAL